MNLQPVSPPTCHGYPVAICCSGCSREAKSTAAVADLDAKPGTYYCQNCAAALARVGGGK